MSRIRRYKARRPPIKLSKLARAAYKSFLPFLNDRDPGYSFVDQAGDKQIRHSITHEDWALLKRHYAGERALLRDNGTWFEPWDISTNYYKPKHVERHLRGEATSYYTSGRNGLALAYIDIDAHKDYQTDRAEARQLLSSKIPSAFFVSSPRGENGYLKIHYGKKTSYAEVNYTFKRLQSLLRLLFGARHILCDVEIKGSITAKNAKGEWKDGSLAKLPFANWSIFHQAAWEAAPVVTLAQLQAWIRDVEEALWPYREAAASWQRTKASTAKKVAEVAVEAPATARPRPSLRSGQAGTTLRSVPTSRFKAAAPLEEPDSFKRQLHALLTFSRRLGRVPSVDEALDHIHDAELFTGDWADNEARREGRVRWQLNHIAKTYDHTKRGTGRRPVELDVRLPWSINEYDEGMTCNVLPKGFTKMGKLPAKTRVIYCSPKEIAEFLAVIEFGMLSDPNPDMSVPCNRIKALYRQNDMPYDHAKIKLMRDTLVRDGVLQCDYEKDVGRAYRFRPGPRWPVLVPNTPEKAEAGDITFIRHESFPRPQDAFLAAELAVQAPVQAPERPP